MTGPTLDDLRALDDVALVARLRAEPNRYDSHLPVLRAIGRALPIQRVLEYGPGFGSTPAFLDRAIFPHVVHLVSYEESQAFADRLVAELPGTAADERWDLRFVPPGNLSFESEIPSDTDLVFVDSLTADGRVALLVRLRWRVPLVVLHDADGPTIYQEACSLWRFMLVYDVVSPSTALVANQPFPDELVAALRSLGWQERHA